MSELVQPIAEWTAAVIELLGLSLIAGFAGWSLVFAGVLLLRRVDGQEIFQRTRHQLVRGILLGLEFLVAADIVHTVAVDLSYSSVGVLAIVVAIRTFLSFTLELEVSGRWPWQSERQNQTDS